MGDSQEIWWYWGTGFHAVPPDLYSPTVPWPVFRRGDRLRFGIVYNSDIPVIGSGTPTFPTYPPFHAGDQVPAAIENPAWTAYFVHQDNTLRSWTRATASDSSGNWIAFEQFFAPYIYYDSQNYVYLTNPVGYEGGEVTTGVRPEFNPFSWTFVPAPVGPPPPPPRGKLAFGPQVQQPRQPVGRTPVGSTSVQLGPSTSGVPSGGGSLGIGPQQQRPY